MLTYVEPRTGRTQQVQKRERVRIAILERIGWRLLVEDDAVLTQRVNFDHYDALNAREAIEYLRSLDLNESERRMMRSHEEAWKKRATVLRALGDE